MRRALIAALVAGFTACLAVTAAQQAVVVPLILKAETFEDAKAAPQGEQHTHGNPQAAAHEDEGWKPEEGLQRIAYTALANLGFSVGFALLLVAAFTLAGGRVNAVRGLLWGGAGFVVFALAPAVGLPPELPGSVAAELLPRQAWWLGTAVATALGLGLIVYGRNVIWKVLGVAAIALPHVVGAPHPHGAEASAVPAELAVQFIVLSLAVTAVFWAVLGAVGGAVYAKVR